MSERIELVAADRHRLDAWRADPEGAPRGGIVVLQAIYGLTPHLGEVCDMYAEAGYAAIAPALYDRGGKDIVFGYDAAGQQAGMTQRETLAEETVIADVEAAMAALRPAGRVAVSGFCTGGSWAWVAAGRTDADAAVIYYGSDVHALIDRTPRCPTLLHYGDADHVVPIDQVDDIRRAHPDLPLHLYPGQGHAFFNPDQANYNADAARLAHARTLDFLAVHLAG